MPSSGSPLVSLTDDSNENVSSGSKCKKDSNGSESANEINELINLINRINTINNDFTNKLNNMEKSLKSTLEILTTSEKKQKDIESCDVAIGCVTIVYGILLLILMFASYHNSMLINSIISNHTVLPEQVAIHQPVGNNILPAREQLNSIKCLEDLPDNWLTKWIPDTSKFKRDFTREWMRKWHLEKSF